MSKRVRMTSASYFGMVLTAFGVFGERLLGISDQLIGYGFIILTIIGIALIIKGREEYESFD